MSASSWTVDGVVDWLAAEGRLIGCPCDLVRALGQRLIAEGAPIDRIRFGTRTIHPLLMAWGVTWAADTGKADWTAIPHGNDRTPAYIGSPFQAVMLTRTPMRRRLDRLVEGEDHRVFFELAANGYTDYLTVPVFFTDGTANALAFSTRRSGGFADDDVAQTLRLAGHLGAVLEVHSLRKTAGYLLNTYLGKRTGVRVLEGQIKRGDGEHIHAALWFSDLRNFTYYVETLPSDVMLETINTYFETVWRAASNNGGEILDFIGDGMMIAFPVNDGGTPQQVCAAALAAAREAFAEFDRLNADRLRDGAPEIRCGVGLHVGNVLFGNVGAPDRLDFRVIGAAVNRTARIEALTKDVGEPLLLSADFVRALGVGAISHGFFALKGVSEPQEVFSLADGLGAPGMLSELVEA